MKNCRKKLVSVFVTLFFSLALLLPVAVPANAVSVNSIDRVRALAEDFRGIASTLTIREDTSFLNDFRDGDRFRLELKPGVKWLRDASGTYVDEHGNPVVLTISNTSGSASLIIHVTDTSMEISIPYLPTLPITGNGILDTMTIPLSVDLNGNTGEIYLVIDPLESGVSASENNFTDVATVGNLPQLVESGTRGWNGIVAALGSLTSGSKRTIKLNGNNDIPPEVFNTVRDRDITLRFEVINRLELEINGLDIAERLRGDTTIDFRLNTNNISRDMYSGFAGVTDTRQFTIYHGITDNTTFDMRLSIDRNYSRQHATLFRKSNNTLNQIASSTIESNGWATWTFEQVAGDYLVVISKDVLAETPIIEAPEPPGEKPQQPDIERPWVNPFSDLFETDWYYEAVKYVHGHKLLTGTSATLFSPNQTMSRGMMVTALWRLAGSPVAGANNFSDVATGEWYTSAISWASAHGIVDGYSETTFAPNDSITREQMAAILYRYASHTGMDVTNVAAPAITTFPDWQAVSVWAETPFKWCYENKIIQGKSAGTTTLLDPKGLATRAEVAAIIMRYLD
jgi:hypothetical protein